MTDSAMTCKLNVKPMMGYMMHTDFWEGPCRGGIREEMTPQAERARGEALFKKYKETLSKLPAEINLMEPVMVPYVEDFIISDDILGPIQQELPEIDYILVLNQRIPRIERFKKPVISFTHTVSAADTCAYLRSIGMEAYYPIDTLELVDLLHLLWVRKAVANTRALILSAAEQPTWGLLSNIQDIEGLRRRYGFEVIKKPYTDIFPFMDNIDQAQARAMAERLEASSQETKVCTDWLSVDLAYYLAAKKMMEK